MIDPSLLHWYGCLLVMVGHHYARRRRARDIRRDAERAARATDEAEDTDVASG